MKKLLLILALFSCSDDYMTVERNIINADNKVPVYFYAQAEQDEQAAETKHHNSVVAPPEQGM